MRIIDTDIIIDYLNGIEEAKIYLSQIPLKERYLTAITMMELLVGCRNKRELHKVKKDIALNFKGTVHCDVEASSMAVELIEKYSRSHGLELADSLIAAIAITKEAVLHTGNLSDFNYIKGMKIKGVTYK